MRKLIICTLLLAAAACSKHDNTPTDSTAVAASPRARAATPGLAAPFAAGRPTHLAQLDTLLLRKGLIRAPAIRKYLQVTSDVKTYGGMAPDSVAAIRVAFIRQWMTQHPDSVALLGKRPTGTGMAHPRPGPRTGPTQRP